MSKELIVGPFPVAVTKEEKEEFLLYFGAVSVRHLPSKSKYAYTIAVFNTSPDCEFALKKIHQVEIFGIRISAKYYDPSKRCYSSYLSPKLRESSQDENVGDVSAKLKDALLKYEAQLSAISSCFGIYNPISPKLRYLYPPPTPSVLSNIAHAMVAVPKFYTQVLHLMNKMNLPCPFGPLTSEPPLCKEARTMTSVFNVQPQRNKRKNNDEFYPQQEMPSHSSDSESELESDEETKTILITGQQPNPQRLIKPKAKKVPKRPKLKALKQSLIGTKENTHRIPKESVVSIEEAFDTPNAPLRKKLSVNVQSATSFMMDTPVLEETQENLHVTEGFGKLYPSLKEPNTEDSVQHSPFVSLEEITSNRIEKSDWPIVPVFKNYNAGAPSPRLYIKNLARSIMESDLHAIFGRYLINATEEEASKFNIRLMKEGRMKGQAFITFPSTEISTLALNDVNGYILKDKPMVIVYGRIKPTE